LEVLCRFFSCHIVGLIINRYPSSGSFSVGPLNWSVGLLRLIAVACIIFWGMTKEEIIPMLEQYINGWNLDKK
jgi:hypothetical protein